MKIDSVGMNTDQQKNTYTANVYDNHKCLVKTLSSDCKQELMRDVLEWFEDELFNEGYSLDFK